MPLRHNYITDPIALAMCNRAARQAKADSEFSWNLEPERKLRFSLTLRLLC